MGVGMATSFALIGIVLGALGPALGIDSDSVRIFGAWLLIAFGLVMLVPQLNRRFTEWMLPIASSANAASARTDPASGSSRWRIASIAQRRFNVARGWVLQHIDGVKKAFGVFILLTGIAILSGADKWLEARVVAILPDAWVRATALF